MSQLKKHLEFKIIHKYRIIRQRQRLEYLGKNVFIDKNVALMRFPKNIFIDDEVVFKEGAKLCSCNANAKIKVGKRTTLGYNLFLFASKKIEIGDDCLIAPNVYIVDSDHQIEKKFLINQQPNITDEIIIGNDVWLANGVSVLKGTRLGDGCIVAANSVVNKSIPPYEIWGGSPARKIGERT